MKKDEALKLALEALDIVNPNEFSQADPEGKIDKAITAIKKALAQPEPDDFMLRDVLASELKCWHRLTDEEAQNLIDFIKHTSPPQRKPLTDEQRREVYKKAEAQLYTVPNKPWLDALIEQTEAAHGIKGDA